MLLVLLFLGLFPFLSLVVIEFTRGVRRVFFFLVVILVVFIGVRLLLFTFKICLTMFFFD